MPNPTATLERAQTRERLLAEAARAFNSTGVGQASMGQIARQAGVSRAAVYYYFEDQQDLVHQCYQRTCESMTQALDEALASQDDAMSRVEHFLRSMLGDGTTEFAAMAEPAFLRPDQHESIQQLIRAVHARLASLLAEGSDHGQLREADPHVVAQTIMGLLCWTPVATRLRSSDRLSHSDLVEATIAILQHGIAADRRPGVRRSATPAPMTVPAVQVFNPQVLAAARREALLASASWLFNVKGVDATSLDEIATRVGVTRKIIYNNVGDKDAVVTESYRRAFAFYIRLGRQALETPGPRIDAICASTHALCASCLSEELAPMAPLGGFDALRPAVREEIQSASASLMDDYLELYELGRSDGSVRDLPFRAVLAMVPGLTQWLPRWPDLLTDEQKAVAPREIAELLRSGLAPWGTAPTS